MFADLQKFSEVTCRSGHLRNKLTKSQENAVDASAKNQDAKPSSVSLHAKHQTGADSESTVSVLNVNLKG